MTADDLILVNHPKIDVPQEITVETTIVNSETKDLSVPLTSENNTNTVKENTNSETKKTCCCDKVKSIITPENALKGAIGIAFIGLVYVILKK